MPQPWEMNWGGGQQGGSVPLTGGDPMKPLLIQKAQSDVQQIPADIRLKNSQALRAPIQLQKDAFDLEQARATSKADRRKAEAQATAAQLNATPTANATVEERKAASFLIRALGANNDYRNQHVGARSLIGQNLAETFPDALNSLPGRIGNSPQRQKADAAQREFVMASLRQDSGAAIPPAEIENHIRTYFPVPGDGPEVIKQKEAARRRVLAGLGQGAGRLTPAAIRKFQEMQGASGQQPKPSAPAQKPRVVNFSDLP